MRSMKIVVLAGGVSTERDVSLISGKEITKALRRKGHKAVLVDLYFGFEAGQTELKDIFEKESTIDENLLKITANAPDIESIKSLRKGDRNKLMGPNVLEICQMADMVYFGLHGAEGENGKLQATFDVLGIRYTGSGYLGSAIGMDKGISKKIFLQAGIPTAKGFTIHKRDEDLKKDMAPMPCVVKPCCGGSSVGVSLVHDESEYEAACEKAFRYEDEILVEEYIKGREFSVGVLGDKVLPIIEIIPNAEFYDYETKYQSGMARDECPARLTKEETIKMQNLAKKVFDEIKLETYARVDFLMKEDSSMYCLEVNTLPGMTPLSLIPQEAKEIGISYDDLCEMIVEEAAKKYNIMEMPGLTVKTVCDACNGTLFGPKELYDNKIFSITTDSRKATTGAIFIAIKGNRVDGNSFIEEVYDKDAICVISENPPKFEDKAYIQVDDIYLAIKKIAKYYLSKLDVKVVGITGSVGKTTTKEMVASVLSKKYKTLKTAGNFNNELGLPLTIFRLRAEHEIAVLEMGISDFNEMDRLSDIDTPDACIITNIGYCHLENLGDRDGVLKAKTEIFNHMKQGGKIFLNGDDDKLSTVTKPDSLSEPVFYGYSDNCQIKAENCELKGLKGSTVDIKTPLFDFTAEINVPGEHLIYAALAATAMGINFGLSAEEIKEGIGDFRTISGRNNIIDTGHLQIIDDCYNANPMSVRSGIDTLVSATGRTIAILGDMKELGKDEESLHYETGKYVASKDVDYLITVGKLAEKMHEGYLSSNKSNAIHYADLSECISSLKNIIKRDDTVLVKASHSMNFAKIVEELEDF